MRSFLKLFTRGLCECPPPHFAQRNGTCSVCAREFSQGTKLWSPNQVHEHKFVPCGCGPGCTRMECKICGLDPLEISPEFRARLHPPKRTFWLGCEVESVEPRLSKSSGRPYALIRFKDIPFLATWHEFHHYNLQRALMENGVSQDDLPEWDIAPGMIVHLDVRWEQDPYPQPSTAGRWFPRPIIDFSSLLANH